MLKSGTQSEFPNRDLARFIGLASRPAKQQAPQAVRVVLEQVREKRIAELRLRPGFQHPNSDCVPGFADWSAAGVSWRF